MLDIKDDDTRLTADEHRRKEQILTQPEPSKLAGSHTGAVLKFDEVFLLADDGGDIPWNLPHAFGLYHRDMRFLNGLTLRVQDRRLVPLANTHLGAQDAAVDLANPAFRDERGTEVPQHTVCARRERRLHGGVLHERITVTNYHSQAVRIRLEVGIRCGFEDVFIVKKFVEHPHGRHAESEVLSARHAVWRYSGIDNVLRETHVIFDTMPANFDPRSASFGLEIEPDESAAISLAITPVVGTNTRSPGQPRRLEALDSRIERADRLWQESSTGIHSSSDLFDRVITRSLRDLRLLRSRIGRHHYFSAGIPWFVTLFGRDAAIAAIQTLPYGWSIARDTFELLARHQAQHVDHYRDAEPGKILHELRRGELARAGEIPQSLSYFGTVDATALFVILLAEYVLWSGDLDFVRQHRGALDAALGWVERRIAHENYLAYDGQYKNGLVNQGWKDSGNAIVNDDGSLCEAPIALAEVQGYAYRAWKQASLLRLFLGERDAAARLNAQADDLAERFDRDFWCELKGCYLLALQRHGRPAAVIASNAGQVLWSGIARPDRARRVADRLMEPDMFSGWGVRTLSSREKRYNPVSYHLGSVWPHDNALILSGLRRYGHDEPAVRIFDALLDAGIEFRGRLPELFCGFQRRDHESPVPYPASSSPQAWAAGALPHGLWNLLGLQPNAVHHELHIVRPVLPQRFSYLKLSSLRIGDAVVDLTFERRGDRTLVSSDMRHGELDVRVRSDLDPASMYDLDRAR
jgi:glycogen debranching enzyme